MWLRPLAEIGTQAIKADQKTMTEFDLLIPGRFQTMSQGERVTYVRDIADSNELSDVFITELEREEVTSSEPPSSWWRMRGNASR